MLSWRATIFFLNINNNFIYFANINLPKFRESVTPSERLQQVRRASVLQPKKIVKNVFGPKPGLWSECLHSERRRALQAQASDPADRGLHRGLLLRHLPHRRLLLLLQEKVLEECLEAGQPLLSV